MSIEAGPPASVNGTGSEVLPSKQWTRVLEALYSESVLAKVWFVASKAMGSRQTNPPTLYPEYTGEDKTTYIYRTLDFWTSGFFPGSLYLLLERSTFFRDRHPAPHSTQANSDSVLRPHPLQHEHLCRWWTANLHQNALRKDTHDLGFMITPWAMKAWTLHRDPAAYNALVLAAHSLASRFSESTQCIRSWDQCITKRYAYKDPSQDFLVIIDNMLNLDMLFWVARETDCSKLYDIARAHAITTQKHHIRDDCTTFHVVNLDPKTGAVKSKLTNQGYSDSSCWARGQAWGILGFVQTFGWTRETEFLRTARALADVFLARLPNDGVPYWDFDAPVTDTSPRDTSAAMIAACGMLLLYKAYKKLQDTDAANHYLRAAMKLVDCTVGGYLNPPLRFEAGPSLEVPVYADQCSAHQTEACKGFEALKVVGDANASETILTGATINNYEFAPRRWSNHGLVYADYYFLLFGNMLLEMDLIDDFKKR
ncbi:glycoside hydrolase family 88 protein [Aspergillus vadensis CBS 113365]|uniref:Glucuronyl hydrolase n=1 Tax=Aspergillus vadensis (strain CBS 113365 / IMI 142717 / IBT 24658) TaxID=1448311 RepID=A0A319B8A3_ASPVC|nr:glucuronyl hydrolase [Aspergillus vadensis CBS 113365]PYH66620.1 glucuronyl hydrolase [Aspergillus vadensis CBS 113365]